jgi:hypothetical protein
MPGVSRRVLEQVPLCVEEEAPISKCVNHQRQSNRNHRGKAPLNAIHASHHGQSCAAHQ